ncbi:Pol protein [Phytophthora palmivora]|uniref:Pol protein n=1 Tax=Phytophthora palmivora TaxID=4796 RepID=A0A2P4YQ56_9STRA|nr:Pol protein [Phytophthora palmivora]
MVHLAPVRDNVTGKQAAQLFLDSVFCYHGLPETIISDRDPRFTGALWDTLFQLLGTKLTMSTLPLAEFCQEWLSYMTDEKIYTPRRLGPVCTQQCGTRINGVYTVLPEWATTPPDAANLAGRHRCFHRKWGEARKAFSSLVSEIEPESLQRQLSSLIDNNRLTLISRVRDVMASAQDKQQKEYSDRKGRGNLNVFKTSELVLLDTMSLSLNVVSAVESNKLKHASSDPSRS